MSPVVESFLAGQRQAGDIQNQARDWQLRQQQLDQVIKQFEANQKLEQKKLDMQGQQMKLESDIAHSQAKQKIMEMIQSGAIPVSQQPSEMMNIPGVGNLPSPSASMVDSPIGTPMTVDMGLGPMTVNRPRTNTETAIAQQAALLPGEIAKYKATIGSDLEAKLESQERVWSDRLASQENMWKDRLDTQNKIAELRAHSAEEIAAMKTQFAMQMQLFNMGFGNGDDVKKTVLQYARERATGKLDNTSLKGTPLNNMVEGAMRQLGLSDLPGGAKTRQAVLGLGTEGATLLNKFDDLNNLYPPASRTSGKIVQSLQNFSLPLYGPVSDLATKYKEFESNLMSYAKTTAGITSSRLMDSNKEQGRFMGSLPKTSDTVETRNDKKMNLIDNIFTHIQSQISSLSLDQRKDFWIDIFKSNPALMDLANDNNFRDNVLKPIISSGNYSSSYLNPLRRSGKNGGT